MATQLAASMAAATSATEQHAIALAVVRYLHEDVIDFAGRAVRNAAGGKTIKPTGA